MRRYNFSHMNAHKSRKVKVRVVDLLGDYVGDVSKCALLMCLPLLVGHLELS